MKHSEFARAQRNIRRKAIIITALFHLVILGGIIASTSGVTETIREGIEAWIIGDDIPPQPVS